MPEHTAAALEYVCPDCNSETRLVTLAPGVYALQVFHDDTCPSTREARS
ncbi:hypothetical protein [Agromyces sp. Root81]|nr:hypothetical protein [Agromyces sp. Root81]